MCDKILWRNVRHTVMSVNYERHTKLCTLSSHPTHSSSRLLRYTAVPPAAPEQLGLVNRSVFVNISQNAGQQVCRQQAVRPSTLRFSVLQSMPQPAL